MIVLSILSLTLTLERNLPRVKEEPSEQHEGYDDGRPDRRSHAHAAAGARDQVTCDDYGSKKKVVATRHGFLIG